MGAVRGSDSGRGSFIHEEVRVGMILQKTRWKQLIGRVKEIEKPLGEQTAANTFAWPFVDLEFIKQVEKKVSKLASNSVFSPGAKTRVHFLF